jgi:hypothetical protein
MLFSGISFRVQRTPFLEAGELDFEKIKSGFFQSTDPKGWLIQQMSDTQKQYILEARDIVTTAHTAKDLKIQLSKLAARYVGNDAIDANDFDPSLFGGPSMVKNLLNTLNNLIKQQAAAEKAAATSSAAKSSPKTNRLFEYLKSFISSSPTKTAARPGGATKATAPPGGATKATAPPGGATKGMLPEPSFEPTLEAVEVLIKQNVPLYWCNNSCFMDSQLVTLLYNPDSQYYKLVEEPLQAFFAAIDKRFPPSKDHRHLDERKFCVQNYIDCINRNYDAKFIVNDTGNIGEFESKITGRQLLKYYRDDKQPFKIACIPSPVLWFRVDSTKREDFLSVPGRAQGIYTFKFYGLERTYRIHSISGAAGGHWYTLIHLNGFYYQVNIAPTTNEVVRTIITKSDPASFMRSHGEPRLNYELLSERITDQDAYVAACDTQLTALVKQNIVSVTCTNASQKDQYEWGTVKRHPETFEKLVELWTKGVVLVNGIMSFHEAFKSRFSDNAYLVSTWLKRRKRLLEPEGF